MRLFVLLFFALLVIQGLVTSDTSHAVDIAIYGCHGDTITLPFASHLHLQGSEKLMMTLLFQGKTIATLISGVTMSLSSYKHRIKFMNSGNFTLKNVSTNDTGTYSLKVKSSSGLTEASLFIDLFVVGLDKAMYKGSQMVAAVNDKAEWNSDTQTFSLTLTCGDFIFKNDNAPIDVEWITPDGSVKNSTKYGDGKFYLQLDNPVEGGQYVCKIPEQSVSTICATSNYNNQVTVDVDKNKTHKTRIILLENYNKKLREQDDKQRELIDKLEKQDEQLIKQDDTLKLQNANLNQKISELQALTFHSCEDWYVFGSGKRTIYPTFTQSVNIYCDQDTDGGRWNVFQRRLDGSVDFYREWSDYRQGFGDVDKEFWLGLETLDQMTNSGIKYELRFDLEKQNGSKYYAVYDDFSIGSESEGYAVHFTGYRGNAGDCFTHQKDMKFTTKDRDNDRKDDGNCAVQRMGAWWYNGCTYTNLNGHYNGTRHGKGIMWEHLTGYNESLKKTEMKFRMKK